MQALLDTRIREREYLLSIGRALTAELDLDEVLRVILRASAGITQSKSALVVLAEPRNQTFRVAAVFGISKTIVDEFKPLVDGIAYQYGSEQDALNLVRDSVMKMAKMTNPNMTHTLVLPMRSGNRTIGAIFVFHDDHLRINNSLGLFLNSFASQAAIAVRNARLYENVIAEKRRLNAIVEQSADGVMILDPSLSITVFNKALAQMTGVPAEDAVGSSHDTIIAWENLATPQDLSGAVANGWPLHSAASIYVEGDLRRADGAKISLSITYTPLTTEAGMITNIIANVRDLTRYREEESLQKTFISVVSHELKTPVSIIKGYAGTLQRNDVEWPRSLQLEYLATIEEEADNLTDLIDNLLEVSRLQAGRFTLNLHDDASMPRIASSVARKFAPQTNRHHIQLNFPDPFPLVTADERRITQVLNNLVNNAIKYSPNGDEIIISGNIHPEHVSVSVSDGGIGIPAKARHRIFQKFSRLDNALSRKTEGTGLGLFLSKSIIDAHDGCIWFEPNKDRPGTTFTFSLPRLEKDY